MKVLVTGCGGFLGSEIVWQLVARGDSVIGVSRGEYPKLVAVGMTAARGDLSDPAFTRSAILGVDAVIHTAAVAGVWGPWKHFYRNNVVATENVIAACQNSGVEKLVFTSSPSVTFDGGDQRDVDETAAYPVSWMCHYPRTKAIAEQRVLAADRPGEMRTVALRPHLIWGADDPHILPRMIDRARRGRLRIVGDGQNRVDTVHVINAAAAHLDALDALDKNPEKAAGRAYFIAQDEPVKCWDWIAQICQIAEVPPPEKRISFRAAFAIGWVLETLYRISGRTSEPPMTRFVASQLARDHYFDISAARDRLGYRVRIGMDEGLERLGQNWRSRR